MKEEKGVRKWWGTQIKLFHLILAYFQSSVTLDLIGNTEDAPCPQKDSVQSR